MIGDPEWRAAELMRQGNTKFRAKKQLIAEGLNEEEANLAAEAGWELYRKARARKMLVGRFVGLFIMLARLGFTAALFFGFRDWFIVWAPTLVLALAGLVAMIAPDTLENFGDWFK